jgi:hypothetical protein
MLQQVTQSAELVKFLAIANDPERISEKWGFRENQRVFAQAVATLPIRQFQGSILYPLQPFRCAGRHNAGTYSVSRNRHRRKPTAWMRERD